ncbi:MAG: histidine phosphatase family protein [Halioglobus sp.]
MDIFLVRHGEAAASWGQSSDPGLSDLGKDQAEATAKELLALMPANIQLISSPLLRAQETAAPLAKALAYPEVAIEKAYSEIPSPVALPQRQEWLRGFMKQRWQEQPESLQQWRNGMMEKLIALQKPTVVFSHFLVLNTVVGNLQGREETLCFWPDNASVTRLRHTGSGLELVALGREMSTVVN